MKLFEIFFWLFLGNLIGYMVGMHRVRVIYKRIDERLDKEMEVRKDG